MTLIAHRPSTAQAGLLLRDLHVRIPLPGRPRRWVHAARGVTLQAPAGAVTAVVGESGCGKSILGLAAASLLPAGTRVAGAIEHQGLDLLHASEQQLAGVRGAQVGLVPQSAATHLNPVRTIGSVMAESLRHHRRPCQAIDIATLLVDVGLDPRVADSFPHELSGGMAQRALVALTLALDPTVVVADEPTSALDSASGEMVQHLLRRHADAGAAVVLITHDLQVARSLADRVAVMYAGELLEVGPVGAVLRDPLHDYTRAVLASLPENGLAAPPGGPSSLVDPEPTLCAWHHRAGVLCDHAPLREVTPGHLAACHGSMP